jgi:hypothetical protein
MAAASDRTRQFPLAARGTCARALALHSFAALDAVRHIPIFVLLAIPVIAAALRRLRCPRSRTHGTDLSRFRPLFNAAVIVLMAVFAVVKWVSLARNQEAREAEQFPQQAVAFLRGSDYPRRLFVYYDWGGYAIWKLYPEYRVFVDGRADLYGDDLCASFRPCAAPDRLARRSRQLEGGGGTVPPSSGLAQALLLDRNWQRGISRLQGDHPVITRTPSMAAKGRIFR